MKRANEAKPPVILLRSYPPERLIRALARGEVAACCGCCCCCCCCLHSLGGLAGAVAGTFYPADSPASQGRKEAPPAGLRDDELDRPVAAVPAGPRPAVTRIFWGASAALAVVTILVAPAVTGVKGGPAAGIEMLILGLPLVLLAGSAVAAMVVLGKRGPIDKSWEWKRLGWITLGTVVGTLIGVGMLWLLFAGR
jgi:hypothetical protein